MKLTLLALSAAFICLTTLPAWADAAADRAAADKAYLEAAQDGKGEPKVSMPLLYKATNAHKEAGDRPGALALLEKAAAAYKGHAEEAKITRFLSSLKNDINAPGVGEDFTLTFTDIDGKAVDLASMKGKVVLIDFWATWCGPCIGELPNVKAAYKAYHDKGFEIIGISLDQDEAKLREFIKTNDMPWVQHFDGQGWKNSVAVKHGIHSIPATYLIGKDGKIAATSLRGAALEEKLAELLK